MGKLIDQFIKKPNYYNYGCNNYNPNYNQVTNSPNRINSTMNERRTPELAFIGYDGPGRMYRVDMYDGNYNNR